MATSSAERAGTSFLPVSVAPPKDEIQPKTPSIALETRQQGRGATPLRAKVRRAPALKTLPTAQSHVLAKVQGIQKSISQMCRVGLFRYDPIGWRACILAYFGAAVDEDFKLCSGDQLQ